MNRQHRQTREIGSVGASRYAPLLATAVVLAAVGCSGGGKNNNTADNPGTAGGTSSAEYNTYIGTQTVAWTPNGLPENGVFQYGGGWSLAIDDKTDFFSYQNVGHEGNYSIDGSPASLPPSTPTLGDLTDNGFLILTANGASTSGSAGYALEIPGQAVMLRPGNDTTPPVIAVETKSCLTLNTSTTYEFISLGTPDPIDPIAHVAYGSLQASSSGVSWTFSNLQMFAFDGTNLRPTALPTGGCGETALGFAVSIAPSTATSNLQVTAQVSSSGYFIMDQGQGTPTLFNVAPGATGPLGLVGVEEPTSQLSTSAVVAATYMGFQYDAIDDMLGVTGTWPVTFGNTSAGQAAGSGTTINGGIYPNDDVTQTPAANISINLGTQDSQNNGLYKSVTVTVPDVYGECVGEPYGGTDASGNPTCTFQGEAVVGNPGGKYAIFVTVNDVSLQNRVNDLGAHLTQYGAMDFFLYQQ